MTALELLCRIKYIPLSDYKVPFDSKSERRRMLDNHAVVINGVRPGPNDMVEFPIKQLVFFPNSRRKCTMVQEP